MNAEIATLAKHIVDLINRINELDESVRHINEMLDAIMKVMKS